MTQCAPAAAPPPLPSLPATKLKEPLALSASSGGPDTIVVAFVMLLVGCCLGGCASVCYYRRFVEVHEAVEKIQYVERAHKTSTHGGVPGVENSLVPVRIVNAVQSGAATPPPPPEMSVPRRLSTMVRQMSRRITAQNHVESASFMAGHEDSCGVQIEDISSATTHIPEASRAEHVLPPMPASNDSMSWSRRV